MSILVREEIIGCANQKLMLYTTLLDGTPLDMEVINWRIFDKSGGPKNQIEPGAGFNSLNLADCPTGSRVSTGVYTIPWTVPAAANVGQWEIEWQFKQFATNATFQLECVEFSVQDTVSPVSPGCYITVQDVRDKGITVAQISDADLLEAILEVCALIDRYTCRHFLPVAKTIRVDGSGTKLLILDESIIDITAVTIRTFGFDATPAPVDLADLIIYNRHIRDNLMNPDDREHPKIEFDRPSNISVGIVNKFPRGNQNIEIEGTFGYTQWDGTATGATPRQIRRLAFLMLGESLGTPSIGAPITANCADPRENRVIERKTRDLTVKYERARSGSSGQFTYSDIKEINTIIDSFRAPFGMSSTS